MLSTDSSDLTLLLTFAVALVLQLLFYLAALPHMTEKYFDLSGALTFWACTLTSLLPIFSTRSLVVSLFVCSWSLRLGLMLFRRIQRLGHDRRFDSFKSSRLKFLTIWMAQVAWVFGTGLPVYVLNAQGRRPGTLGFVNAVDVVGWVVWVSGWGLEIVADWQKDVFKRKNPSDFISTGLWRYSRHPNYFGEFILWVGIYISCAAGYDSLWQYLVTLISPLWTFFLLRFATGVPALEKSWESRYGTREDFQRWKASTSTFWLWFPKKQ